MTNTGIHYHLNTFHIEWKNPHDENEHNFRKIPELSQDEIKQTYRALSKEFILHGLNADAYDKTIRLEYEIKRRDMIRRISQLLISFKYKDSEYKNNREYFCDKYHELKNILMKFISKVHYESGENMDLDLFFHIIEGEQYQEELESIFGNFE